MIVQLMFFAYKKKLGRIETRTRDRIYCQTMRTVRDISRDDWARIATCSLRTLTDRLKENYRIDVCMQLYALVPTHGHAHTGVIILSQALKWPWRRLDARTGHKVRSIMGFRKGRGTDDGLFVIRCVMKSGREFENDLLVKDEAYNS